MQLKKERKLSLLSRQRPGSGMAFPASDENELNSVDYTVCI